MKTEHPTVPALTMACMNRRPQEELHFHSDRSVQYGAASFRDRLNALCPTVRQSMSRMETLDGKHHPTEVLNTLNPTATGNGCSQHLTIQHLLKHFTKKWFNLLSAQPGQVQESGHKFFRLYS
jgi:hypothetical protein